MSSIRLEFLFLLLIKVMPVSWNIRGGSELPQRVSDPSPPRMSTRRLIQETVQKSAGGVVLVGGGSTCRTGNKHLCHTHLRSLSAWRCLKEGWGGGRSGSRLRPPHSPSVSGEQRDCSRASNSRRFGFSAVSLRRPQRCQLPPPPHPRHLCLPDKRKNNKKNTTKTSKTNPARRTGSPC